ncbi:MAG: serine/threonine-protein kinase [Polyangiaceae bacterium]
MDSLARPLAANSSEPERTLPAAPLNGSKPAPRRVGQYRLRGVLGCGGMAKVYLAESANSGVRRYYAVKVPHDEYANAPDFVRMFENESSLAAQLQHPHVCCAHDFGHFDGKPYLAMEFLRGRSLAALRAVLRPADDPLLHAARCARILADACEGLQAVHEHGSGQNPPPRVVHRDISPDNLLLTTDGFVKIIDFGLAKVETRREKTEPGLLKGKMAYIAPELLSGESPSVRSDVWSLGVVAWELLTGRRLFNEPTDVTTLVAVREQVLVAPSTWVPGLPKALDAVVMRALERDPERRFQSAEEFGRELWAFMTAERRVVRHAELAAFLHEHFPADRDVLQSLGDFEWEELDEVEYLDEAPHAAQSAGSHSRPLSRAWRWFWSAVGLSAAVP